MLSLLLATLPHLAAPTPLPQQTMNVGPWRAWLDSPGGELPFGLVIENPSRGELTATLINGVERISTTRLERAGDEVTIVMEHYDSSIAATLSEGGKRMDGTWRKRSGPDAWAELPFHATAGGAARFAGFANAGPGGRIAGRWEVDFSSSSDPAVAVFEEGDVDTVSGTFLTTTGDYRYLAGTFQGDTLKLSCFDGAHAFLFHAKLQGDGSLAGDFWSRDSWHETWTARANSSAQLPDAFEQTIWNESVALADLVFPDLAGTPRSLAEPGLAGKGMLLQVFGTWCPNCYDETEYLVELYQRYRERGLSIVGLAFELTGDFDRDSAQVGKYVERHGIEYPILIAGTSNKARATEALAALDRVRSYPTTIFLGADGTVHAVHTGFSGPATGPAYDHLREEFERRIEALLTAEAPSHDSTWAWLVAQDWIDYGTIPGGDYRFFEEDGVRRVLHRVHGSGRPILATEVLDVTLAGNAVWLGDTLWRADRHAGVLYDPRAFGARLAPPDRPTPLLLREGADTDEELVGVLKSDDPVRRREALFALGNARRHDAALRLPEAVPLLGDESLEVRVAAAWAAGVCRELGAQEGLIANLASPNAALRRESAAALARIAPADPAVLGALRPLLGDPDPLVKAVVEGALNR
ncbi:MAG: redoxin family protein [Planctomycetota bacterium]